MASIPQPLQSNTLEGLFLEVALLIQKFELTTSKNPQEKNFIQVTVDTDTKVATIAMALPIDFNTTQNGGYVVAYPYLVD